MLQGLVDLIDPGLALVRRYRAASGEVAAGPPLAVGHRLDHGHGLGAAVLPHRPGAGQAAKRSDGDPAVDDRQHPRRLGVGEDVQRSRLPYPRRAAVLEEPLDEREDQPARQRAFPGPRARQRPHRARRPLVGSRQLDRDRSGARVEQSAEEAEPLGLREQERPARRDALDPESAQDVGRGADRRARVGRDPDGHVRDRPARTVDDRALDGDQARLGPGIQHQLGELPGPALGPDGPRQVVAVGLGQRGVVPIRVEDRRGAEPAVVASLDRVGPADLDQCIGLGLGRLLHADVDPRAGDATARGVDDPAGERDGAGRPEHQTDRPGIRSRQDRFHRPPSVGRDRRQDHGNPGDHAGDPELAPRARDGVPPLPAPGLGAFVDGIGGHDVHAGRRIAAFVHDDAGDGPGPTELDRRQVELGDTPEDPGHVRPEHQGRETFGGRDHDVGTAARLGVEDEAALAVGADGPVIVAVRAVEGDARARDRSLRAPLADHPLEPDPLEGLDLNPDRQAGLDLRAVHRREEPGRTGARIPGDAQPAGRCLGNNESPLWVGRRIFESQRRRPSPFVPDHGQELPAAGDLGVVRDDAPFDPADGAQLDSPGLPRAGIGFEAEVLTAQAGGRDEDGGDLLGEERGEHGPAPGVGDRPVRDPLGQAFRYHIRRTVEGGGPDPGAGDRAAIRPADEELRACGRVDHHRDGPVGRHRLAIDPVRSDHRARPVRPEHARLRPPARRARDLQAESPLRIGLGPSDNLATTRTTPEVGKIDVHRPGRPTVGVHDRPLDQDRGCLRGPPDGAERADPDRHQERGNGHRDVSSDVIRGQLREFLRGG